MSARPAFIEAGDPEDPTVVFLHGWPTSSLLWRDMVTMVSPWMRAIAPDLTHPGDLDGSTAALGALLDDLGVERLAVVGHAEGGGIAQLLAVEGRVETMVLIDAVALDVRPATVGDAETTLREGVRIAELVSEEVIAGYLRDAPAGERVVTGIPPDAAALSRLTVPTLVLWGEDDPYLPVELAERLGEALPMAAVALLPGCGHFLTLEAPETVSPLIFQYLRSQYLQMPHSHEESPVTVEIGRRPPEDDRW